jgi:hypothetical protein
MNDSQYSNQKEGYSELRELSKIFANDPVRLNNLITRSVDKAKNLYMKINLKIHP